MKNAISAFFLTLLLSACSQEVVGKKPLKQQEPVPVLPEPISSIQIPQAEIDAHRQYIENQIVEKDGKTKVYYINKSQDGYQKTDNSQQATHYSLLLGKTATGDCVAQHFYINGKKESEPLILKNEKDINCQNDPEKSEVNAISRLWAIYDEKENIYGIIYFFDNQKEQITKKTLRQKYCQSDDNKSSEPYICDILITDSSDLPIYKKTQFEFNQQGHHLRTIHHEIDTDHSGKVLIENKKPDETFITQIDFFNEDSQTVTIRVWKNGLLTNNNKVDISDFPEELQVHYKDFQKNLEINNKKIKKLSETTPNN